MITSSTEKEKVQKKLQVTEACLEGVKARLAEYNHNDPVLTGLEWAFIELKEEIERFTSP